MKRYGTLLVYTVWSSFLPLSMVRITPPHPVLNRKSRIRCRDLPTTR